MALFAEAERRPLPGESRPNSFIPLGNASTLTIPNLKLILAAQ